MGARGSQRLVVDWPRCDAHGLCAEVLPELVALDEWGYPVVAGPVPDELRRAAARARDACPAVALRLERAGPPDAAGPPRAAAPRLADRPVSRR